MSSSSVGQQLFGRSSASMVLAPLLRAAGPPNGRPPGLVAGVAVAEAALSGRRDVPGRRFEPPFAALLLEVAVVGPFGARLGVSHRLDLRSSIAPQKPGDQSADK